MKGTMHVSFVLVLLSACIHLQAQKIIHYNLAELLKEKKLATTDSTHTQMLTGDKDNAISTQRLVWLKDVQFADGTIDVDLRGKDVFLQSFLGIAFHGQDDTHYEVIYFRPFNFNYADTARRRWSVQYMVIPEYSYNILRAQHPLMYENAVSPVPKADEWFHATIVVKGNDVTVYVNHSKEASLHVTKLKNMNTGGIGLWDDQLPGDFANLTISQY